MFKKTKMKKFKSYLEALTFENKVTQKGYTTALILINNGFAVEYKKIKKNVVKW